MPGQGRDDFDLSVYESDYSFKLLNVILHSSSVRNGI